MKYTYMGFSFLQEVVFRYREFVIFFKTPLDEFNEFNCLVSMDRLFHCLSVDGKKKS